MVIPAQTYRPMPIGFPERFGWEGIEDETRAHKDTIRR